MFLTVGIHSNESMASSIADKKGLPGKHFHEK